MKITPENIVERHSKFPEATADLIRAYAYQAYRDALSHIQNNSSIATNPHSQDTVVILMSGGDYKSIMSGNLSKDKNNPS